MVEQRSVRSHSGTHEVKDLLSLVCQPLGYETEALGYYMGEGQIHLLSVISQHPSHMVLSHDLLGIEHESHRILHFGRLVAVYTLIEGEAEVTVLASFIQAVSAVLILRGGKLISFV